MTFGKRWQSGAIRLLICMGLAATVTGLVLQFSFRHGRLSTFLRVDDVGYISDGMVRLTALEQGGWPAVWKDYLQRPPHSPYSDFFAMAALAVFGKHDWAVYAANSLLALAFIIVADRVLNGMALWQRVCCLIFFACVPVVGMAVHDYYPDFAVGLLTAAGMMLLLTRPFARSSVRHKLLAGTIFGLAMLVKPPVFPAPVAFFFASVFFASLCDRYAYGDRVGLGRIVAGVGICLIPLVLIPLPHYLVNGAQIIEYIHDTQWGSHQKVWAIRRTFFGHVGHYLIGDSGSAMLGKDLYVLAGVLALGAFDVLRSKRVQDRVQGAVLASMLLLAWLQPTLNPHKQQYLGLTFQIFLVLVSLRVVSRFILAGSQPGKFYWRDAVPIVLVVLGLIFCQPPTTIRFTRSERDARTRIVNGVYSTIWTEAARHPAPDGRRPFVLLTCAGDINGALYLYYAMRDSRPLDIYMPPDSDKPEVFAPFYDPATFVIASEPDSQIYVDYLLSSHIQPDLLHDIRQWRRVERAQVWVDPGLHIHGDFLQEYFSLIATFPHPAPRLGLQVWVDFSLHLRVNRSVYVFQKKTQHLEETLSAER